MEEMTLETERWNRLMYLTQSDGVLLKMIGWEREELIENRSSMLKSGMTSLKVFIFIDKF
ncbi:hypothetical protein [Acinetobacter ursingii]|uniref:hypothetical protein n=2 Tax=Acinetobacter ursingii TaxID=108980 RepID=UPI00313BF711